MLLRVAAAVPFLLAAFSLFSDDGFRTGAIPFRLIGTVIGAFLLLGLGTPIAAALQLLIEGWLTFASGTFNPNHGARALMGLALMMLGPGQYSVDRRLYGRKRIELGP